MIEQIGNCKVIEEVGAGGMAVVYKATQEPLGRVVAVKALKSSIAIEPQFSERFEREAKFMASLQQENIINVYDFIKFGGTMFIVMEYIEGVDLYDLLDLLNTGLSPETATIIALQVARALNHAHFRGIIHRDIKPANVMLSKRGDVKLMDFGIARDESLSDLTETGTGLGTPSYMSPEQILGDKLDQRTDIWSLGVVYYQMLTGRKPFTEDARRSVLQKIRLDQHTPSRKINPNIPRNLERILSRCLEKQPADRYESIQALIHDLEDFLASRVLINYNAYMVSYLRESGFLSADEASGILATGAIRAGQKVVREDKKTIRFISMVHIIAFGIMLFSGMFLQLTSTDDIKTSSDISQKPLGPGKTGFLRVSVTPWAQVHIDDELVDTTPFAAAIPLSPGTHYVDLINPYFQKVTREIKIEEGKTITLFESLLTDTQPKDQAKAKQKPKAKAKAKTKKGNSRKGKKKRQKKSSRKNK